MRNQRDARASLMVAAMIAAMGAGMDVPGPTLRTAGSGNRRPTPVKRDTALQREIAEHNEAVERRKAEKKARRLLGDTPPDSPLPPNVGANRAAEGGPVERPVVRPVDKRED